MSQGIVLPGEHPLSHPCGKQTERHVKCPAQRRQQSQPPPAPWASQASYRRLHPFRALWGGVQVTRTWEGPRLWELEAWVSVSAWSPTPCAASGKSRPLSGTDRRAECCPVSPGGFRNADSWAPLQTQAHGGLRGSKAQPGWGTHWALDSGFYACV